MSYRRNLWVLEPDAQKRKVLKTLLGDKCEISFLNTTKDFQMRIKKEKPDLVISDVRVRGQCLIKALEGLRKEQASFHVPLLITSSVDDAAVIRKSFDLGVKDFLVHPISMNELFVKVERTFDHDEKRLSQTEQKASYEIQLDQTRLLVFNKCGRVKITPKEMHILSLLKNESSEAIAKEQICLSIWGDQRSDYKRLNVHIHNLRKKIQFLGAKVEPVNKDSLVLIQSLKN